MIWGLRSPYHHKAWGCKVCHILSYEFFFPPPFDSTKTLLWDFLIPCKVKVEIWNNSWHRMRVIRQLLLDTSLPSWDKSFSFQVLSFYHTQFLMSEKTLRFAFPIKGGRPRYFSYCWFLPFCHKDIISCFKASREFLLKIMTIFYELINWPYTRP